jgi:hypothetical protein
MLTFAFAGDQLANVGLVQIHSRSFSGVSPQRLASVDSEDTGEAHWIGSCAWKLWLAQAALPDRLEAHLFGGDTPVVVADDGVHRFADIEAAVAWLSQEGFVPACEVED